MRSPTVDSGALRRLLVVGVVGLMAVAVLVAVPAGAQVVSADAVMVVGDPVLLSVGDAAVRDRLEGLGYGVSVVDDNGVNAGVAADSDLVLISSTVKSYVVGSTFRDAEMPVWVAKPWSLDDMAMTGSLPGTDYGTLRSGVVTVVDPSHPLAAGLTGPVTVTEASKTMSYGEPGPEAMVVTSASGRPSTFVYQAGEDLADGSSAAGCRIHSSIFKDAPAEFSPQGWLLFDAVAEFAVAGCVADPGVPDDQARVIVISIDGLRSDAIATLGPEDVPNLHRLVAEGASTLNARAMYDATQTLPNHTSIVTATPVLGGGGHGVIFNEDNGLTVHDSAGRYVPSMFDVAHDAGLATSLYAGKPKFDFLERSWDGTNGAPDIVGVDDGEDKLDLYLVDSGADVSSAFVAKMASDPHDLALVHYAGPDTAGHSSGWLSSEYYDAIREVDGFIGQILSVVESSPALDTTFVIVTSDHGGVGTAHGDPTLIDNARVPFIVWGAGVTGGADIYNLNTGTRVNPGLSIPNHSTPNQPIRNADAANLALGLLDLQSIPGSSINAGQDLAIDGVPVVDDPPSVVVTAPVNGSTVSGAIAVTAMPADDVSVSSVEFSARGVSIGTDADGSDGWSQVWDTVGLADGPATLSAVATDSIGQTAVSTVSVTIDNGAAPSVVMVVSNPAALTSGDTAVRAHLEASGYEVRLLDDAAATPADASGAVFVFIASSINSSTLGATFAAVPESVWVAKPWLLDDLAMTGPVGGTDYGTVRSATVTMVDSGHPLAAGFSAEVTVSPGDRTMSFGVPGGTGQVVSTAGSQASTFLYPQGATLADGSTAPGCRIHATAFNTAVLSWTSDAWALFDATAAYAASGCI